MISLLRQNKRFKQSTLVLLLIVVVTALFSLYIGAVSINPFEVLFNFVEMDDIHKRVFIHIRLPRIVLAFIVGAGLAVAGATMQALFRNPLADPGLVGVTAGASLGAVLWIVFESVIAGLLGATVIDYLGLFCLPICAFFGALLTTSVVCRLAKGANQVDIMTLLLAGIACNAIVGAIIGLFTYMADDAQLRSLTFWGMGSLGNASWQVLSIPVLTALMCIILLMRKSQQLNALLLGEREAHYLGWSVEQLKRHCIWLCVLLVASCTAITGGIGFVGLVVPHLCRLIVGPDNRLVFPLSALLGAFLLLASDALARSIIAPAELPIGIITASIGGPFFMFLLVQQKRKWSAA